MFNVDIFAVSLTKAVVRRRVVTIAFALLITGLLAINAVNLGIANHFRVFFSAHNPELSAFKDFQASYTKNDNFLFVLEPDSGDAFDTNTLSAIERLTAEAWALPYAIRVDSVSNFQYTLAQGDELIVENLFSDAVRLETEEIARRRAVALAEPLLRGQLISIDGAAAAVNVVLQYPERNNNEVSEAASAARALGDQIRAGYPGIDIYLTGVSMLNNAIIESSLNDAMLLTPLMYLTVLVASAVALRSVSGVAAMLLVISCSVLVAMGAGGLMAIELTGISLGAPTVIMTLAVADSIHILIAVRKATGRGMNKQQALIDAMRVNFLPICITSLTTIVGFLTLNFSDAPPFAHLGNMTAVGIFAAWVFSLTLLPAMVSALPFRAPRHAWERPSPMLRVADFVVARYRVLLAGTLLASLALVTQLPGMDFDDQWVRYFDQRVEFRTDSDAALKHFGLYPVEFSVPAGAAGGVSDPEFLARLERFTEWLRAQPGVKHVYSLADIIKRLNMNMHGDDEGYFRLPQDRRQSAQYLLLYELSLPYGLDLNDRINIDKSATRVTATLGDVTTAQTKDFLAAANDYIDVSFPPQQRAKPTSAQVMFTYITDRNVDSMIGGTVIATVAISLILIASLRSVSLGLLSLVPNGLPILLTFGAWAVLVGEVGLSVASVASISIGIVVDDTVHFLFKYQRARRELGYDTEKAIRYAFDTVGLALLVTTVILALGFAVLTYSSFKLNVDLGLMTLLAIVFALLLDFLLLPSLLLSWRHGRARTPAGVASRPGHFSNPQPLD